MKLLRSLWLVLSLAMFVAVLFAPTTGSSAQDATSSTVTALQTQAADLKTMVALQTEIAGLVDQLTPSAGPAPTPGSGSESILYEADSRGGFEAWGVPFGWSVLDGELLADGTHCTPLVAPVDLAEVRDYAVEAEIQWIVPNEVEFGGFGVFARWRGELRYWGGFDHVVGFFGPNYFIGLSENSSAQEFHATAIQALTRTEALADPEWHLYRLEVDGNRSRLFVDGAEVARAVDNRHLTEGDAGVWCYGNYQIAIRSFRVIAS